MPGTGCFTRAVKHSYPVSDKRLHANRRNALASTGPKSAKGKQIASHNAVRHGFTGHIVILTPEEREAHELFCQEIIENLNPATAIERQIAHSIAEDHFRLNRLRAAEANILAKAGAGAQSGVEAALDAADAYLREAKQLQFLGLYEQRINRAIHKNLDQLRQFQSERKAEREKQLEQAALLAQQSLSKGIAYDAGRDGFVFSTAEINARIDRNNRLNEALSLNSAPGSGRKGRLAVAA